MSYLFWRSLCTPDSLVSARRGALVGVLTGLFAHPLAWYLAIVWNYVVGARSSLGDRTVNPLDGLAACFVFAFSSILLMGWLTVSAGGLAGWFLGKVLKTKSEPPSLAVNSTGALKVWPADANAEYRRRAGLQNARFAVGSWEQGRTSYVDSQVVVARRNTIRDIDAMLVRFSHCGSRRRFEFGCVGMSSTRTPETGSRSWERITPCTRRSIFIKTSPTAQPLETSVIRSGTQLVRYPGSSARI